MAFELLVDNAKPGRIVCAFACSWEAKTYRVLAHPTASGTNSVCYYSGVAMVERTNTRHVNAEALGAGFRSVT